MKTNYLKVVIGLVIVLLGTLSSKPLFSQVSTVDLPTAGFDTNQFNPVFIQSKDGQFKLNLGMYTQVR